MKTSDKYKFHFLSLDKSRSKTKSINSTEILTGYINVEITIEEFIKSIITCGMPMYYLTPSITHSRTMEISYKLYALLTLIEFDSVSGYIRLRKEIKYLDASEKATLSYYLGMVLTRFISYRQYGQDYLVHLNILEKTNSIKYKNINKKLRPDLIGYSITSNKFSVFEAKGNLRKNIGTVKKALEQVQNVNYIVGTKPSYAVAQLSYFKNNELYVVAVDPVDEGNKEIKFNNDCLEQYFKLYYEPIIGLFDEGNQIEVENEKSISLLKINDFAFSIEIPAKLYFAIKNNEFRMENLKRDNEKFDSDLINIRLIEGENE